MLFIRIFITVCVLAMLVCTVMLWITYPIEKKINELKENEDQVWKEGGERLNEGDFSQYYKLMEEYRNIQAQIDTLKKY